MAPRRPHRETLPFALLVPNFVTIFGMCLGLTSIRYVFVERFELAVVLILLGVMIDGLDGLLARRLKAASLFGAELDSLSDFLVFGVAPGILVYHYALQGASGLGWVAVLVYASCCCLRLARFNVTRDDAPTGGKPHFIGVPAPAGAMLALGPVFLSFSGIAPVAEAPVAVALYLALVGALMVSRVPTFSPKALRISREWIVWVLIAVAMIVGVGFTRFWLLMVVADVIYALSLIRAFWIARRTKA